MRSTLGADRSREHMEAHGRADTVTLLRAAADISHDWAPLASVPSKLVPGERVNE